MFRNRMVRYIAKRLLLLVPVLAGVSFLAFSLINLAPGNAATYMLGDQASAELVAELERQLNLDQPFLTQYFLWLAGALQGDFGTSFVTRIPIATLIAQRLTLTLELAAIAIVLTLLIAIPLGVNAAAKRNRAPDHAARIIAVAGVSIPDFWSGIILIFLLGVQFQWVSPGGYTPLSEGLVPHLRSVILPASILAFINLALITRMLRASMLETLSQNYIQAARSFGVPERELIWRDALKNAFIPTLTVIGLTVGIMLSGAVMLETVFSLPGVGKLLVDAVFQRDIPVLQSVLTMIGCFYVVVNLIVDIGYSMLDPRIRY
jgi:peptide/nickel transport system permease protein